MLQSVPQTYNQPHLTYNLIFLSVYLTSVLEAAVHWFICFIRLLLDFGEIHRLLLHFFYILYTVFYIIIIVVVVAAIVDVVIVLWY